jgi:hypothetical protein
MNAIPDSPGLTRDVERLATVLSNHFDISGENMCTDVTHIAAELLRAKGYDARHVGASAQEHQLPTDIGHAWVRVGDWNIDFTLSQFEGMESFPYPLVSRRDSGLAMLLYGAKSRTDEGVDDLKPSEASQAGYPLLRDLHRARKMASMCDLKSYRKAAKEFLRES